MKVIKCHYFLFLWVFEYLLKGLPDTQTNVNLLFNYHYFETRHDVSVQGNKKYFINRERFFTFDNRLKCFNQNILTY